MTTAMLALERLFTYDLGRAKSEGVLAVAGVPERYVLNFRTEPEGDSSYQFMTLPRCNELGLDVPCNVATSDLPWKEYRDDALCSADKPDPDIAGFFDKQPRELGSLQLHCVGAALGALGYCTNDPKLVRRFYDFIFASNDYFGRVVNAAQIPRKVRIKILENNCCEPNTSFANDLRAISVLGDPAWVDLALQAIEGSTTKATRIVLDLEKLVGTDFSAIRCMELPPHHEREFGYLVDLGLYGHRGVFQKFAPSFEDRIYDIAYLLIDRVQHDLRKRDGVMERIVEEVGNYGHLRSWKAGPDEWHVAWAREIPRKRARREVKWYLDQKPSVKLKKYG